MFSSWFDMPRRPAHSCGMLRVISRAAFATLLTGIVTLALATPAVGAGRSGLPVSLTTALVFGDNSNCQFTVTSPCPAAGTFTADDAVTAAVICPSGTITELYWFIAAKSRSGQPHGPITVANRTWTCPDGSMLVTNVQRWGYVPLTDSTASILETWVITGGTGSLAGLQGSGTMNEVFDFEADTLGGAVNGTVR